MKEMPGGEYSYGIKGNTAVKPLKKTTIRKPKKNSQIRKRKKNHKKKLFREERQSDRKYMFTVILFVLGLGCITIAGDSGDYIRICSNRNSGNNLSGLIDHWRFFTGSLTTSQMNSLLQSGG